jgi:sulfite oxidase
VLPFAAFQEDRSYGSFFQRFLEQPKPKEDDPHTFFKGLPKGPEKVKLPVLGLDKVREDHDGHVWVTYKGGVYDVTVFLDAHPGGSGRIEMASGSDLSHFWNVYQLHHRPHIKALLEEFRIGNLSDEDRKRVEEDGAFGDAYLNDPKRDLEDMRLVTRAPFNAEPKLKTLMNSFHTPNDKFFVRNHNAVPDIDPEEWRLEIEANPACGLKAHSFTLAELKKLPKYEVTAALQCAGNRQEDYVTPDRPLYVAPHWRNGAIGNAKWGGVRVRDVLGACGMPVDDMSLGKKHFPDAQIVNFIGADVDETGSPYAAVVPVAKCIDPFGDTILAYEMNGETLPKDHGFPIRALAPGTGGCRNCKWVTSIGVSAKPSELDSGSKLDRHFCPEVSWTGHREHVGKERVPEYGCMLEGIAADEKEGPVIQSLPVQSVLCWPPRDSVLSGQTDVVRIEGVAYSGAGRGVARVEVSLDNGEHFYPARLKRHEDEKTPPPEFGVGRNWAWVQFAADIELPADVRKQLKEGRKVEIQVCSKAIDGDFNSQPESMRATWNVLGICVNHWPRMTLTLDPSVPPTHAPVAIEDPAPGAYWRGKTPN